MSQAQVADLFGKGVPTINEHIKNIFADGEITDDSVIKKFFTTASDGKSYNAVHYNLDAIISVGYRVNSAAGVQFRE